VSRPLTKYRTLTRYEEHRDKVIREALVANWSLQRQIDFHSGFMKKLRYKIKLNEPGSQDKDLMLVCGMVLIKLKAIDEDGDREGLLICPRKRNPLKLYGNKISN
tara:strand:- start:885 stop:1199 length:315 start_codon:yes stop_codon:yes gene_type:complete